MSTPESRDRSTNDQAADDQRAEPIKTGSPLDEAAAMGPIPGVAAEEAAQQRGEDHSGDNEPKSSGRGLLGFLRGLRT